jgi:hypothetical protein
MSLVKVQHRVKRYIAIPLNRGIQSAENALEQPDSRPAAPEHAPVKLVNHAAVIST